jgi:hypothetical protein
MGSSASASASALVWGLALESALAWGSASVLA